MTKIKKQIITISLLVIVLVAAVLIYLPTARKHQADSEKVLNTPALKVVLDGDTMKISGFKKGLKYRYSSDYGTKWTDVKGESVTLDAAGMYCFKEVYGERSSEFAWVAPFGEPSKNGRPFILEEVENEEMNSIFVKNTFGEYTLKHLRSGEYKIEGLDGYEADQAMLAQLRVNAMHLLALKFVEKAKLDEPQLYGIDKENPEVYFVVTYNDEKDSYKIILGDKTPDGSGYYAMLDGRDALYVVDTGVEACILQPKINYVTPKIVDTIDESNIYSLRDFSLKKKGEQYIIIEKASSELTYGNNASHRLTYPAYNYATSLANFEILLGALRSLAGSQTLYYGDSITDELLAELGFFDAEGNDTSDYSVKYAYPAFSEYLYIMEREEGDYLVYSLKEKIIVSAPAVALEFLKWDMIQWVSAEIYMLDIEDIASVEFEYGGEKASFKLVGSGDTLEAHLDNVPVDILKFKELYKSIMYVLVTSYTKETEYGAEQLGLTITTEKGEVLEYRFYTHSATNSYYTLNGFGEFYVSADKVLALRENAFALANK